MNIFPLEEEQTKTQNPNDRKVNYVQKKKLGKMKI